MAWRSRACTRSSELTPDGAPPAHQGNELEMRLAFGLIELHVRPIPLWGYKAKEPSFRTRR